MRGYNIDPIVFLSSFQKEKTTENKKEDQAKKKESVVEKVAEKPKEPIQLYQHVESQRISGNTAFTIAGLLLLVILIVCIMDARTRISRLEMMVQLMAYKNGGLTQ